MRITKAQAISIIARQFISLGNGLRVEEIAALSGLSENQVWSTFKGRIDFQNKGEQGWFYTSTRPISDLVAS